MQKQYDDRRAKWDIDEKLYLEANLEILRLKTQMERDQSKYNILQDELATQTTEVAKLRDLLEETRKEKRNESANFLAQVENITRTRVPSETYNLLKEEKDNATHQLIEERADFKYRYSQLEEEKKEYQLKYERLLQDRETPETRVSIRGPLQRSPEPLVKNIGSFQKSSSGDTEMIDRSEQGPIISGGESSLLSSRNMLYGQRLYGQRSQSTGVSSFMSEDSQTSDDDEMDLNGSIESGHKPQQAELPSVSGASGLAKEPPQSIMSSEGTSASVPIHTREEVPPRTVSSGSSALVTVASTSSQQALSDVAAPATRANIYGESGGVNGPRYQFLVSGTPVSGHRVDVAHQRMIEKLEEKIEEWEQAKGQFAWRRGADVNRCVAVRTAGYSNKRHPPHPPAADWHACRLCISIKTPCVMVVRQAVPVVLPLPPTLRPATATERDFEYYVVP